MLKRSTVAVAFLRSPSNDSTTTTANNNNNNNNNNNSNNNELSVQTMMMMNIQLLLTYHKDILVEAIIVLQFTKTDEKR